MHSSQPHAGPDATPLAQSCTMSVVAVRCDSAVCGTHARATLSYVRRGSLTYSGGAGQVDLVPGALIVAPRGASYTCWHRPDAWAECISFRFDDSVIDDRPGHRPWRQAHCLPPVAALMVLGGLAQAARIGAINVGLDEIGVALAARTETLLAGAMPDRVRSPSAEERRGVIDAALRMETHPEEAFTLEHLAQQAGFRHYRFLRVFAAVTGVTPHQYLIQCRLRNAARLLAEEDLPVTEVAQMAGFGDLSNFVRSFRRACGQSPRDFRLQVRKSARGSFAASLSIRGPAIFSKS